jgi:hypothetical protein
VEISQTQILSTEFIFFLNRLVYLPRRLKADRKNNIIASSEFSVFASGAVNNGVARKDQTSFLLVLGSISECAFAAKVSKIEIVFFKQILRFIGDKLKNFLKKLADF